MKIIKLIAKESIEPDLLAFFKKLEIEILSNIQSNKGERIMEVVVDYIYVEYIIHYLNKHFGGNKLTIFTYNSKLAIGRLDTGINEEEFKKISNNTKVKTLFNRKNLNSIESAVKSGISNINYYYAMIVLSSIVAGAGLMGNSPAVIIGSMVIAPLLGPNVALAFSISVGDVELLKKSIKHFLYGIILAFFLALVQGYFIPFEYTHEIMTRTNITYLDLMLAFCSGIAGVISLVVGANSTLVGVMIAVALMPPLVSVGLLLGKGDFMLSLNAFLLFISNVIVINLAGILTFRIERVEPKQYFLQQVARQKGRRLIRIWILTLIFISLLIYLKK